MLFSEANGGTPLHVAATFNHVLTAHILLQVSSTPISFLLFLLRTVSRGRNAKVNCQLRRAC
jgi:hypothetical protein